MKSVNQPRPALGQAGLLLSSCLVNQRLVAADSSSCLVANENSAFAKPASEAGIVEPAEGIEPSLSTTSACLEDRDDTRAILLSELYSLNSCSKRFTSQGEGKFPFLVKIPCVYL